MIDKKKQSITDPADEEAIVETVRDRYAGIATAGSSCCGPSGSTCGSDAARVAAGLGYAMADLELLPEGANLGLGCGAPLQHLELAEGETFLDLGSGAGIDALIAAREVGPTGTVIGVDMTPEMLEKARANTAGWDNIEFRQGRLEELPVDDASVDAVTSNCVINLVPDKGAVFSEIARVLRPGGRLVISDIVLDGELPAAITRDVLAYVGCVAGASQREDYFRLLAEAGLGEVEILKDADFLEMTAKAAPAEVQAIAASTGITIDDVRGIVRSVTYRARKV
ncbi:MAG: arsenite methyltransferase [Thermoanaerobaculales bacterium]